MKFNSVKLYSIGIKTFKILKQLRRIGYYFFKSFIVNVSNMFKTDKSSTFLKVQTESRGNKINLAFLGKINEELINTEGKQNRLVDLLDSPDVVFYYGYGKRATTLVNDKIINLNGSTNHIVEIDGYRLGVSVFNFKDFTTAKDIKKFILENRRFLKKGNCTMYVAYIASNSDMDRALYKKLTGLYGYDYVVGCEKRVLPKKNFRSLSLGSTRVLYSVGNLIGKRNSKGVITYKNLTSVALRCEVQKRNKKLKLLKEGFIPLYVKNREIIYMRLLEDWNNGKEYTKNLKYVYKQMRGFRNWYDIYTVGDIAEQLNVEIPDKYSYVKECSVNTITARTFETCPGTIFFFRQQFNDKNDKKLQNEFLRTRMAFKVFSRKNLFIFSYKKLPSFIPHVVIKDAREAHIQTMAWYKKKFLDIPFIGVTGSIGKTSTKDMIFSVLNEKFNTERNLRNTNVQVKIGLNMQNILPDTELFVQEIGGGRPGGASRHSRMVLPDLAVVTNIGTAHIGNFGSQELLMANKLGIAEGMSEDGTLLLNGDDPLLINADVDKNVIYYAVDNKNADYYVEDIVEGTNKTFFTIVHGDHRVRMRINVIGKYNVLNAVCAYAIAKKYGMTDKEISSGLKKFQTSGVRQNIIKVGGYTLFMDCYNASLESVKTSLSVLNKLPIGENNKKIAIIGDLTGVGNLQEEINTEVASTLSQYDFDNILCYGNESQDVSNKLKSLNNEINCTAINDAKELETWMSSNINIGDVALLKGSSKAKLDERVDNVFGTNTCDQRYIDEAEYITLKTKGFEYKLFGEYASIKKYKAYNKTVTMKDTIAGKKITKLWPNSMANNSFEKVVLPNNLIQIGKKSFANCSGLREIVIPDTVKFIGNEAFANCKNLEKVTLPNNLVYMGKDVFINCDKLSELSQ